MDINLYTAENILIINPGSSSIKWAWYSSCCKFLPEENGSFELEAFDEGIIGILLGRNINVAVIRFVHGGSRYFNPIKITPEIAEDLEQIGEDLSPLHIKYSIKCWEYLKNERKNISIIAVFDTAYFNELPDSSKYYGLPENLIKKYSIRKYGFHGFAHASLMNQWLSIRGAIDHGSQQEKIITLQLGGGCSMAAIKGRYPIDTTMGFTPTDGLLMSTRSGSIDPSLVTFLQRKEGISPEKMDELLNQQSGWYGLSGLSKDMAVLANSDNRLAQLAINLFCQRIRNTIGSYLVQLGGLDALIFGGGISENNIPLCRRILSGLEHIGIVVENDSDMFGDANLPIRLTSETSKICAWVVETNEHYEMLRVIRGKPVLS